jgi:hypothetical protein
MTSAGQQFASPPLKFTMSKVLVTFNSPDDPTVTDVIDRFVLDESEIDRDFGVIEIDPNQHLFTALVERDAAARIREFDADVSVHSNPEIRPFAFGRRG